MRRVTAIIPTFNEEHNIAEAIQSVNWSDEIIVVDSFSTDNTVALAENNGAKVIQRKYDGPATQKNWAIPQAKNEWVFILDADERVEPVLAKEIKKLLSQKEILHDAFWIRRRNFFMGKEVRFCGWQRDKVIRLIKKDVCRYNDVLVHEEIETTGSVGKLKGKLTHYTYKNILHYLEKWNRYTTWAAEQNAKKTPNPGFYHLTIKPAFRFFKNYLLDFGFLDGKVGFIICRLSAMSVFMRYIKIRQSNK
ncbi:MAG: glycosyltransferase family 2 protein [Flavobacteriales bacterium]